MITKKLRLFMLLALAAGALVGCGGGSSSGVASSGGSDPVQGLTAPAQVPLANAN